MLRKTKKFPHIHIAHVSDADTLSAIKRKGDGARLTAETCPHYLYFSAESIGDGSTLHKCPSNREEEKRLASVGWFVERRGIRSDFFGPLAIGPWI